MIKIKIKLFATLLVVSLVPLLAHADVDCSGVPEWSRNNSYKKDQRVWVRQGSSTTFRVYRCDKDKCWDSPGLSDSGWKLLGSDLGHCK
jgi:hypothetical protein